MTSVAGAVSTAGKGSESAAVEVDDLGVKKGPFYVLFMSSMSSVLVETGFVTNKRDAKLLRSTAYQTLIAEQIAVGVDRYRQQMELGLVAAAGNTR